MDNSGEAWGRRHLRRKLAILAACALISGLAPLVIGIAGDESVVFSRDSFPNWGLHLPLAARVAVFLAFMSGMGLLARLNWQNSDEVRRAHLLGFWAAIGICVSLTFFAFMMFGNAIPEAARLPLAFFAPIGGGCLFAVLRWSRDGFMW